MGKWQRRGTQTLTLSRNHPQCPAWGGGSLLSQELQCYSPGTDHKAHWFFHVEHKLEKSRAIFLSCVENMGWMLLFPSQWNLWAILSEPSSQRRFFKTASCREQDGSDSAACVHPFFLLPLARSIHIRALSAPPQSLSASDQQGAYVCVFAH